MPQVNRLATGPAQFRRHRRIQRDQAQPSLKSNAKPIIETSRSIQAQAPEGADNIKFTLRSVTLDGVSVFNAGDLEPLYANKIGKAIPLSFCGI